LLFNPNKRFSIEQIINHPFLEKVKNKDFEKEANPVIMEFEEEENLTVEVLRKYLANEIKGFIL